MPLPIEDYALIGDCQTAALVGKDGSIDWMCLPRFDSGACFAALLGDEKNGRWKIAPDADVVTVRRTYRDSTLILETTLTTATGVVRLIDFMPPRTNEVDLVRIVEGVSGRVKMTSELVLRFDYGSIVPWVTEAPHGISAVAGPDMVLCRTPVKMRGEDFKTCAEFEVNEGDRVPFVFTWIQTHGSIPEERDAEQLLAQTEAFWSEWSAKCTYRGEYRHAVLRSLITLKALSYAPTGGICAAATCSLPEKIGGVRNWDYRFCWLRDATFSLLALQTGGYNDEAIAWREWLVNAAAGTPEQLQIMYGLAGERRLVEMELDWLPGYEGSKPVRVGNDAYKQFQLDVYGEVMDALYHSRKAGDSADNNAWRVQRALARFVVKHCKESDEGIWEVRGKQRQFTHSKVMAWVALDRAIKSVETFAEPDGDIEEWRATRKEIFETVCRDGFDKELNSFVQFFGSKDPDASLLMLPLVGFLPATDDRMRGTIEYVQKRLLRDGLLDRYPCSAAVDGLPPGEGSFLMCTFWLADNLALLGKTDEARAILTRLLSLRNDVGLLAEQYDTVLKRLVGNFPQAFSHTGLINTVAKLEDAMSPPMRRCMKNA